MRIGFNRTGRWFNIQRLINGNEIFILGPIVIIFYNY